MTNSAEHALAASLAGRLLAQERRASRALLLSERAALADLRRAAEAVTARARLSVQSVADERDALVAVRRSVPALRNAVEAAILDGRAQARRAGRADRRLPPRRASAHEEDAAAAHTSASSYAAAWGAAAIAAILSRSERGRAPTAGALSPVPLDYRLRRIAATEMSRAFNDERVEAAKEHYSADIRVWKLWSAVLDRRTCGECFDLDGRTIELRKSFGRSPPLHVHCRCLLLLVEVPHPKRLPDIAIDYDALKAELRDMIRERHLESDRHAAPFVRASMGRHRSPVALTEKFRSLTP